MNQTEVVIERLLELAAAVIKLVPRLCRTMPGRHVAGQLMRSSASSGANYEEACGAESRADFIHKMQIVLKELRETRYWLRLVRKAGLAGESDVSPLLKESDELTRIVARTVITAKSKLT